MIKTTRLISIIVVFFAVCMAASAQSITFNCTKSSWSTIGSQNGENIGTVRLNGTSEFDHFEAEIKCQEDPDQYITFANCNTNGGSLICYAWEGGHYDLNKDYHYTITIRAYEYPYYNTKPVATLTKSFIGTGVDGIPYSNVTVQSVSLKSNGLIYNGYTYKGGNFDVTFTEPVSKVEVWCEIIRTGVVELKATKKSADSRTWTINPSAITVEQESIANLMVTAWDMRGIQMRGESSHAYPINLVNSTVTGINEAIECEAEAQSAVFNLAGQRVNAATHKGISIINGKKVLTK